MEQVVYNNPNLIYWVLFIGIAVASWIVSSVMESRMKRYAKVPLKLTGKEVAEKMLRMIRTKTR